MLPGSVVESHMPRKIDIPHDLLLASKEVLAYIEGESFIAEKCGPFLNDVYSAMYNLPLGHFDLSKIKKDAAKIIENIGLSRLALHHKIGEFYGQGKYDRECFNAARAAMRAGRYIEDVVGEMYTNPAPYNSSLRMREFAGGFPWTLVNPKYQGFDFGNDFKSGDILISRGNAYNSAAIARMGTTDTQFSHLSLVYVDRESKRAYTIEALIEVGVVVAPLEKHLTSENNRVVLLRHPDGEFAHKAAKLMYDRARQASESGENIRYDFSMNSDDDSKFFCSEVASQGFKKASDGKVQIPLFQTELHMKNRALFDALDIQVKKGFIPADIFMDPRFEMIAEWRDFSRVHDNHMKDAILTKVYEWMEQHNYQFKSTARSFILSNTIFYLRKWPGLFKKMFPEYMNKSTFNVIILLDQACTRLYKKLRKADRVHQDKYGVHMTVKAMHEELERIRVWDLERYKAYEANKYQANYGGEGPTFPYFHHIFGPKL
jgi:hypothetical protein